MSKLYNRVNWQDAPSTETPLDATNLNTMDKGIDDLDTKVEELSNSLDTRFSASIVNTEEGENILLTDSTDGKAISLEVDGRSTQTQGNFFDGELLNGYYNSADGNYVYQASGRICSKNTIPCKSGDIVKIVLENNVSNMYICYYNESGYISMLYGTENTNIIEKTMPDGATRFTFWAVNSGMTVDTAGTITVTVNGSVSYPNPDYPQNITSVGDMGYFDGELLQGYYLASNGKYASYTDGISNKNPMPCNSGDNIKVTYETSNTVYILYYDANKTYLSCKYATNGVLTDTAPTNARYFNFNVMGTGITPANAKHICVTINGQYALKVKSKGKNLWEYGDLSATRMATKEITLPIGTYTISTIATSTDTDHPQNLIILSYENGTSKLLYINRNTRSSVTLTTTSKVTQITFYASGGGYTLSANDTFTFTDIQIEKSEIMTDYESYKESTTYIPLTEPLRSSLDGTVKDEITSQDGVYGVERHIASEVYNGSEIWSIDANRYVFRHSTFMKPSSSAMSNYYRYSGTNSVSVNNIYINSGSALVICDTRFATVDEWKTWLSSNPITVEYELAEPTFEPFADQTPFSDITLFSPCTYITNSANTNMRVEYIADTKLYIDKKFNELATALVSIGSEV